MGNTFIVDLIVRELAGESIATRASFYDKIYFTSSRTTSRSTKTRCRCSQRQVMALKIIWISRTNWVVPAAFFFHERQTDLMAFRALQGRARPSGALNRDSRCCPCLGAARLPNRQPSSTSPASPSCTSSTRVGRTSSTTRSSRRSWTTNLALLGRLAGEMAGEAEREFPGIDSAGLARPRDGEAELLGASCAASARAGRSGRGHRRLIIGQLKTGIRGASAALPPPNFH